MSSSGMPVRLTRLAVVEAQLFQRQRAVELLSAESGIEVVYDGESIRELLSWMRPRGHEFWPHILVLDLELERGSDQAIAAIAALRDAGVRIVLHSMLGSRSNVRRLRSLSDGVVSKFDSEAEFLETVHAVSQGQHHVTARASEGLAVTQSGVELSTQETRVLDYYVFGLSITQAGAKIGVRPDTARKYLSRVKDKYRAAGIDIRSKMDLCRAAWDDGYGIPGAS